MYTSSRGMPTASRYLFRSLPAAPTKGIPDSSSFCPGASPMNIRRAFSLPVPKTILVLVLHNSHFRHCSHSHLISGTKEITIHNSLKVDEDVVLLKQKGGQKYLVLDRVVKV